MSRIDPVDGRPASALDYFPSYREKIPTQIELTKSGTVYVFLVSGTRTDSEGKRRMFCDSGECSNFLEAYNVLARFIDGTDSEPIIFDAKSRRHMACCEKRLVLRKIKNHEASRN